MRWFNLLSALLGLILILVVVGQTTGAAILLVLSLVLLRHVRQITKDAIGRMIHDQTPVDTNIPEIFLAGMQAKAKGLEYVIPEGQDKYAPTKLYIGTKPQNLFGKNEFVPQAYIDGTGYHPVQYVD